MPVPSGPQVDADGDLDDGVLRHWHSFSSANGADASSQTQQSPTAQRPSWTRLISTSPMTTPRQSLPPSPTKSSIPIPQATTSSNTSSAGSYEEGGLQPSNALAMSSLTTSAEQEDPWLALKQQLTDAINPLVEAGQDELDAYSFGVDMDKRLAEATW